MPIIFHCEACKKKIQAPDNTGGKYANCPHCKHRVYIPLPKTELGDDEIKLAPLDEEEERRKAQLMRETYNLQQTLLKQKEAPENADLAAAANMDDRDVLKHIIIGLRQMVDGNMESAEKTIEIVAQNKKKALHLLDRLAMTDMPEPELKDIPPQVLNKFIRNFRSKMQ
jgi:DNA-directed RNA polymerase subunit RPC12/RpoP